MTDDDRAANDALDRALDRLIRGQATPPIDGIDTGLATTAALLQRQFLSDPAASPTPDFLRRLEHELMGHGEDTRPIGPQPLAAREPVPTIRPMLVRRSRPHTPARHRGRAALALAAMLLLTLAAGIGAFRLRPESAPRQHGSNPGIAASGSPSAVAIAPASETGCDVALPASTSPALTGTPGSAAAPIPSGTADQSEAAYKAMLASAESAMAQGQPADAGTARAVTETVDELFACMRADDAARTHALFTDDYWRRHDNQGFAESSQLGPNKPDGFHPDPQTPTVDNVRRLPDGRVGVVLMTSTSATPGVGIPNAYMFFTRVGERWLIDDAVVIPSSSIVLEFTVTDSRITPDNGTVFGQDLVIVLRNLGTNPHSLVIPRTGVRLEAGPGQVVSGSLKAAPGRYQFYSDMPGDKAAGLTGTLTVASHATPEAGTPVP